mgnify:CR=1 FL=1
MSNRLFQGLVHQMRDTIDAVIGVVDDTATIIACSDLTKIGTTNEFVSLDLSDSHEIFIRDGYTYKPFGSRVTPDYAVFVEGVDEMERASFSRSLESTVFLISLTSTMSVSVMLNTKSLLLSGNRFWMTS